MMVEYTPRGWLSVIFRFQKGDTLSLLWPGMITVALYTIIVVYIERNVFDIVNSAVIHSLLAFVISLLLVFRTNTAYERWWEGQKLWWQIRQAVRSISLKLNALLPAENVEDRLVCATLLSNFSYIFIDHLRQKRTFYGYAPHPAINFDSLNASDHMPNAVLSMLYQKIIDFRNIEILDPTQLRIMDLDVAMLQNAVAGCERIKASPIPVSYRAFLKKFIFAYILTLPFGFGEQLGYYLAPIVSFVFYVVLSLELIAASIEDPFGSDTEDIPLLSFAHSSKVEIESLMNLKIDSEK